MNKDNLTKLIERLLAEGGGPGPEHDRLQSDLKSWAVDRGFTVEHSSFKSGARPDVLRSDARKAYLLCGDAKDSSNETVDTSDTLKRNRGYFDEYASLLGDNGFAGGHLAVATNSEAEAKRWMPVLNTLASSAGIIGEGGTPPDFRIVNLSGKSTWVVYW